MISILVTAARQLLRHWPPIMAWFLAGTLVHYIVIQFAGWVGAYSGTVGTLLLPVAVLARLVSFVAMFLVVRDGMRQLERLAPLPETPAERRDAFLNALLAAIVPFVAFYAAWGLLREDAVAYATRALEVNRELIVLGQESDQEVVGDIALGPWAVAIVAVAFGLRWLHKRYAARLPKLLTFAALYLEVLWVYLTVALIGDLLGMVAKWVQARQAIVWLGDLREWVAAQLLPLSWIWDAIEWLLGEAGGIILLPLAWLTIAGVVYGRAVAPPSVRLRGALVDKALSRWERTPGWLRTRLAGLWSEIVSRFQPIGKALVLMWRTGPVLIGGYVLLYTLLLGLESLIGIGITRVFGPNELDGFWMVNDQLLLLAIPLIIEPLRIVLVSSSYDRVIGELVQRQAGSEADSQGSTVNSANLGSASVTNRFTENGPAASSGTR